MPYRDPKDAMHRHHAYYVKNREQILEKDRRYYWKNRERIIRRNKRTGHAHFLRNRDLYRRRYREWAQRVRLEALRHYSNGTLRCACCGWKPSNGTVHRLEIDHINGGGRRFARENETAASGQRFAHWLKKNGFPLGFRVLCAGCNHMMEPGAEKCLRDQLGESV